MSITRFVDALAHLNQDRIIFRVHLTIDDFEYVLAGKRKVGIENPVLSQCFHWYTVKPVCNDHLYNKIITCDLFINVF